MGFEWHVGGFFSASAFELLCIFSVAGIIFGAHPLFAKALSRDGTLPGDVRAVPVEVPEKDPTFAGYRAFKRPPPPALLPRLRDAPLSVRAAAFGLYAMPWLWPALQCGTWSVCMYDDAVFPTPSQGVVCVLPFLGIAPAAWLFRQASRTFACGSARAVPTRMRLAAAVQAAVHVAWALLLLTADLTSSVAAPMIPVRMAVLAILPIGLAHAELLWFTSSRVFKTTVEMDHSPANAPYARAVIRIAMFGLRAGPLTWAVLSFGGIAASFLGDTSAVVALLLAVGFVPAFVFFRRTDRAFRQRDFDAVELNGGRAAKISLLVGLFETMSTLMVGRKDPIASLFAVVTVLACLNVVHGLFLWYAVVMARSTAAADATDPAGNDRARGRS